MAPRGCSLQALRLCALLAVLCAGCRTVPRGQGSAGLRPPAADSAPSTGSRIAPEDLPVGAQADETGGLLSLAGAQADETGGLLRLAGSPAEEAPLYAGHQARAERAFQLTDFELAYGEYLAAVNSAGPQVRIPGRTWLRLAQIAFYEYEDSERGELYARWAAPEELTASEQDDRERLRRRLSYRELGPATIGLGDGNVSALRVDGDDLWIGTWNGGVCRFSLSSGEARVFREGRDSLVPETVRSIEVSPSRVWVGTYQGLFAYSKPTGTWQAVRAFGGDESRKVEALRLVGGRLYVGTLGQGLWRQEGEGWRRISAGLLPGDFVTCLEADGEDLLIGTLTRGVVTLDLASLKLRGLQEMQRSLANITLLLADAPRGFWIGTYGMGLYYWDRQASRLQHFSRAGGELGDDWVLCAARAAGGTYFGTLGGGLSRYSGGSWGVLGFRQGVPAADIPALAYAPPFLYLGSLGAGVAVLREALP